MKDVDIIYAKKRKEKIQKNVYTKKSGQYIKHSYASMAASKQSKFMKEGSYGCIYKPGLKCDGTSFASNSNIISKIKKKQLRSDKEPEIGNILKTHIPYYERYFSPALENCKIELSKIKKTERQKCNMFQKHTSDEQPEYISMKMTYVGKNTFGENMDVHYENSPQSFWVHLKDSYEYLLCALEELENLHMVHYDIKETNIFYSDTKNVPILIDFGNAFQTSDLYSGSNLLSIFSLNPLENIDWPRCLEVYCIANIVHGQSDWESKRVKLNVLQTQVETFFDTNSMIALTEEMMGSLNQNMKMGLKTVSQYKQKWIQYIQSWKGKLGKTVVNDLLNHWNTWDMHSLHMMYLGFMYKYRLYKNPNNSYYIAYLADQLWNIPNNRNNAESALHDEKNPFRSGT